MSTKNLTICDSSQDIQLNRSSYGVITSPNYPNWQASNCLRILRAPEGYVIRLFINDYSIEEKNEQTNQ